MPDMSADARPLIFGEVLFDAFPDGSVVLGGAPFNVAWHLQGFGLDPLLISRIGRDALGGRVLDTMHSWGMEASGVQHDEDRMTGTVSVTLKNGQPEYEIVPDQAWDHIEAAPALAAARATEAALVYHGTLALRTGRSRDTLMELRRTLTAPACIDINLRPPWSALERLAGLLQGAGWVKLNDAELGTMIGEPLADAIDLECAGEVFRRHHAIGTLLITRGADGSLVIDDDGIIHGAPVPVGTLVDTVGAGDAFSAVALFGLLRGWPAAVTLDRALRFASDICGRRGATTTDRTLYARHRERWESDEQT